MEFYGVIPASTLYRIYTDWPNEGVILERSDQRRDLSADHGLHDVDGSTR